MKYKIIPVLLSAMLLLLSGCAGKEETERREAAEQYVLTLGEAMDDKLSLQDAPAEQYGDIYAFAVHSEQYNADFKAFVNTDGKVSDTYYAVALRDSAEGACAEVLDGILNDTGFSYDVQMDPNILFSALSGKRFDSIYEACKTSSEIGLFRIIVSAPGGETLPEDTLLEALNALKDKGLAGRLVVTNDPRVFEFSSGGLSCNIAGGADGGSYIESRPYPDDVQK